MSRFDRASGVLLHITSLPGEFGVGDLGPDAYRFVDFLAAAGQRIWQILPLGPTTRGDSPYSCYSAFAGNPLLISPRLLVRDGLLSDADLQPYVQAAQTPAVASGTGNLAAGNFAAADYESARRCKAELLKLAFANFLARSACTQFDEFEAFCTEQRWWLDDFAMFSALMKHFSTDNWCAWESALVSRQPAAMIHWRNELAKPIEFEQFVQFIFRRQWNGLRSYAQAHGVKFFGDMPIFVAHGSSDVWAHQRLFWLEPNGAPQLVAGVPPDYFSKTGQLWGNPLYNWDVLAKTNYGWWTQRFRNAFELYDLLRIDHFRGFEAYWEIPATAKTAVVGRWAPGPGAAPFEAAERVLGELPIVAEDLGMITDAVHVLRDELDFPGMRVLQFGFDSEHDTFHRPEAYPIHSAAYTGTHDNSTILGWYLGRQQDKGPDILDRYLQDPKQSGMPIHWQLISMVLRSLSELAIIPLQDVLGLDDRARMNVPGQADGNWRWRYCADDLNPDIVDRLRIITLASDR